jgi:hypothetical protein
MFFFKKKNQKTFAILLVAAAIWVCWAVFQGYDLEWDVLNYHYYNGFALVRGRVFTNLQPAMLQTYYGPALDAVFYVLVRLVRPTLVVVILAAVQSVAFPILIRLGELLLAGRQPVVLAAILTMLGAAAPVSLLEAGSPRGDSTTAVLVLAALLCVIGNIARAGGSDAAGRAAMAGILAGLATGLKLTNAPFALGLLAALLVPLAFERDGMGLRRGMRGLAASAICMAAALLVSYGWWGLLLYRHLGNPVFPNFNQIFHSPYAAPVSYADQAFALPGLQQKLLLPFVRNSLFEARDPAGLYDIRMAVTLPLCVAGLAAGLWQRSRAAAATPLLAARLALLVFVLASYLSWLFAFHLNRYLVAIDMVAPVACIVAISLIWPGRRAAWAGTIALAVALPACAYHNLSLFWLPYDRRHSDENGYFGVSFTAPAGLDHAAVAMLGDRPTTFVIPFFPRQTVFARLQGSLFYPMPGFNELGAHSTPAARRAVFGNEMGAAICRQLDAHGDDLFVLRLLPRDSAQDQAALAYFGLQYDAGSCTPVHNRSSMEIQLCRASRLAAPECRGGE